MCRSSRSDVFSRKVVFKICSKLRHGCSPVNLLHIFRKPFLKNTSGWLLLDFVFKNLIKVWAKVVKNVKISCNERKFSRNFENDYYEDRLESFAPFVLLIMRYSKKFHFLYKYSLRCKWSINWSFIKEKKMQKMNRQLLVKNLDGFPQNSNTF